MANKDKKGSQKKKKEEKEVRNLSPETTPKKLSTKRTREHSPSDEGDEEMENLISPEASIAEFHGPIGNEEEEENTQKEGTQLEEKEEDEMERDSTPEPAILHIEHLVERPQESRMANPATGISPEEERLNRMLVEAAASGFEVITQSIRSELERLHKIRMDRLAPVRPQTAILGTTQGEPKPKVYVKPKATRSIRPATRYGLNQQPTINHLFTQPPVNT
jgi:hypothetical protein